MSAPARRTGADLHGESTLSNTKLYHRADGILRAAAAESETKRYDEGAYAAGVSGEGLFVGVDRNKHSVVIPTRDEENRVGMKPSDLLLVALASCTAVDVVSIMRKKRQPLSRLEVMADASRSRIRRGPSARSI